MLTVAVRNSLNLKSLLEHIYSNFRKTAVLFPASTMLWKVNGVLIADQTTPITPNVSYFHFTKPNLKSIPKYVCVPIFGSVDDWFLSDCRMTTVLFPASTVLPSPTAGLRSSPTTPTTRTASLQMSSKLHCLWNTCILLKPNAKS